MALLGLSVRPLLHSSSSRQKIGDHSVGTCAEDLLACLSNRLALVHCGAVLQALRNIAGKNRKAQFAR